MEVTDEDKWSIDGYEVKRSPVKCYSFALYYM